MYYKNDNGNLLEALCVEGPGYSLPVGGADSTEGWHWLEEDAAAAREFFGLPPIVVEQADFRV